MAKIAWNEDAVKTLTEGYAPEADDAEREDQVQTLMATLEKSKRQVVGKLVSLGVYVAPEKPRAARKVEGPTKGELLNDVDAKFGAGFSKGFEGATKDAITRLLEVEVEAVEAE